MIEKDHWTLKEIRDAYGEILRAYDVLNPPHSAGDYDESSNRLSKAKGKEVGRTLKGAKRSEGQDGD